MRRQLDRQLWRAQLRLRQGCLQADAELRRQISIGGVLDRGSQRQRIAADQRVDREYPDVQIGRKFGGRDHTTVMHAVRKIEELREQDVAFAEDVELLRRMLEG